MSFDFSTLITDRTQADVAYVRTLAAKISSGTASEDEIAEFKGAALKGAYSYHDLNRVTAAMESLKAKLEGYGYRVPGYQRITIDHNPPPVPGVSRLPEGYLELSYIESTGTQYVDTGVSVGSSDFSMQMKVRPMLEISDANWSVGNWFVTMNDEISSVKGAVLQIGTIKSKYAIHLGMVTDDGTETPTGGDVDLSFALSGNTATLTGESTDTRTSDYFVTGGYRDHPILICDGLWRTKGVQMEVGGTLVRDYIPCINPDGGVGLYDLVTETFFGNSGTGAFVAGAVPVELPEGYTQVEYIESSGTQYIDTGVSVPHATARVVVDFAFPSLSTDADPVTGHDYSTFSWTTNMLYLYKSGKFSISKTDVSSFTAVAGARYVFDYTSSGYSVNGGSVVSTSGSYTDGYNDTIFYSSSKYGKLKLYSYRLYDGEALVRDYVPCTNSAGTAGLFDMVTGDFYQNAGSGTFAVGEAVDAPAAATVATVAEDLTEYDPHLWYEFDWPTPETMTVYLLNVAAIRAVIAVLKTTPSVPTDLEQLTVQEANDIEVILLDVYRQLTILPTTFIPCGEALCGGDNL